MPSVQTKAHWLTSILALLQLEHLRDRIFGYDLFISYDFDQAGRYATKLKEGLEKEERPVRCFLDREGFHPGDELTAASRRRISMAQYLAVLLTSGVGEPKSWVPHELELFTRGGRKRMNRIIPLNVAGSLESFPMDAKVRRFLPFAASPDSGASLLFHPVPADEFATGPSAFTISRIRGLIGTRRIDRTRLRFFQVASAALACLLVAVVFLYFAAESQRRVAIAERDTALRTQSRFMAQSSQKAWTNADVDTALALAVEALPRDTGKEDRPYVVEAERALQDAVRHSAGELVTLRGHTGTINSAEFSVDGKRVLTASEDRTARLWEAASGKELVVLRGHKAVFSPDGTRVLTASRDGSARLWDAASGKELVELHDDSVDSVRSLGSVGSVAFSPDGTRVLTASRDGSARLWDAASGKELAVLRGHEYVTSAIFSLNGTRVLTASSVDKTARLWEAASGKELAVLGRQGEAVTSAVRRQGEAETSAVRRQVEVLEALRSVGRRRREAVASAVLSFDGTRVLTTSEAGTARLWEAGSGKEVPVLHKNPGRLVSAVFSSDGKRVLTASTDRTARLWDAASWNELAILRGHEETVTSAIFSSDGRRVLTTSTDRTARLWEAANGKELAVLRGHEDTVTSAIYSSDGTRVLTVSLGGMVRLWQNSNFATTQQWIDYACSIMARPLTRKQRQEFFLEDEPKAWPCGWSPGKEKPAYSAKAPR